jgi:uncharacterized protein YxjI
VDIGFARGSEAAGKRVQKEIEGKLLEAGISLDKIQDVAPLIKSKEQISRLLSMFEVDDIQKLVEKVDEDRRSKLTVEQRRDEDQRKLQDELASAHGRATTLENTLRDKEGAFSQREKQLIASIEKTLIDGSLRRFAEPKAYDPEDVIPRLRGFVKLVEDEKNPGSFSTVITDGEGKPRLDKDGKPFGFDELVDELLTEKPHLRKAGSIPGSGTKPGDTSRKPVATGGKFTAEQLRDPKFFEEHRDEIINSALGR